MLVAIADVAHYVHPNDELDQGSSDGGVIRYIYQTVLYQCLPEDLVERSVFAQTQFRSDWSWSAKCRLTKDGMAERV